MMRILVTGVGGDIGNGIGRILRETRFSSRLIGCDIHSEHLGHQIFDACVQVPRVNAPDYLPAMRRLHEQERFDAVLVTSEPELRFFSDLAAQQFQHGLPLVMANQQALVIGFDKLKTAQWLRQIDCPAPWTIPVGEVGTVDLPAILKPRHGAGSHSVQVIRDEALVPACQVLYPGHIWQEYLAADEQEFTCGVYGCANGEIRTIIFRRRLAAGVTTYAEVVRAPEIDALCTKVAKSMDLRGSINVQLRLGPKGPTIFEINPRFSSTVMFRHRLGFEDLLWSLKEQRAGASLAPWQPCAPGARVFRAFHEVIEP